MKPGDKLAVYLQESPVGSGRRVFSLVRDDGATVTLLYLPSLTAFRLPARELRGATVIPVTPSRHARAVKVQRARRKRLGIHWAKPQVKALLAILEPAEKRGEER